MHTASTRTFATSAALAAAIAMTQANAIEAAGWYVGGSIPVVFIDDTHTATDASVETPDGTLAYDAGTTTEYDAGFKLDAVAGYEFGNGWRTEGEAFYAQSGVNSLTYTGISLPALGMTLPGETVVPVDGDVKQMGLALNLWYDFNEGSKWRPYVGGGLVWVRVDQSDLSYDESALTQTVSDSVNQALGRPATPVPEGYVARVADTDSVIGYHVGGGLGYEWSERVTAHIGYRRQTTAALTFAGSNANSNVESRTDLKVNFIEVGLRYRF